ncbi:hypothetical protein FOA52_002191 [Chlamydomonas sp. UWO 241]|nr:hypothetical protein FOA52_002191 [Chlamydomonas sp. UWO 241]
MITLTLYTGWLHILLAMLIGSLFSKICFGVTVLLFSTLLLPPKPVLWKAFNESWAFKTWREYFKFSYLFEEHFHHDKRYIFAEFPHGVFPMGPLIAGSLSCVLFPDFEIYSLAATSVFSIPGWRHFLAWIGSVPATTANFKRVLKKGSVAIIVGGIAEMFLTSSVRENVMVRTRKGFCRVAVEEGVDGGIVPVYHMGNSRVLDCWPQHFSALSRRIRAALGFLYGRFGLPLPRPLPIFMVTGKAIKVTKTAKDDPGFDAEVDRVHALVVSELQALYDRHKAEYGWANRPLVLH